MVSTNIRFDNPQDGENRWEARRPVLASVLQTIGADIVATQEGWHRQIGEIDADLPGYRLADAHREWIEERMYPCIFCRADRVRVAAGGDIWLSETPTQAGSSSFGSAFPRLATWVRAEVASVRFFIVNMHLDNTTHDVRRRQSEVACTVVSEETRPEEHLVVMGDFNEAPGAGVWKAVSRAFDLYDPWIRSGLPERGSYHAFEGDGYQHDRIDWILLDKRLTYESIGLDASNRGGRYPSDHYPVVCRGIAPVASVHSVDQS